jgi:hypothetical protein
MQKRKSEVHHLSIETKISTIKHKQHYEIDSKFRPLDGYQMVNTKFQILYCGKKSGLKCNKINTNKVYSFRYTYN